MKFIRDKHCMFSANSRALSHICKSLLGSLKCQPIPRRLRWHSYSWSFIPSSCTKHASYKQAAPPWQAESSHHSALLNLQMPQIYLLTISQVWTLFILLHSESVKKEGKITCSARTGHGLRMRRQGPEQTLYLLSFQWEAKLNSLNSWSYNVIQSNTMWY